MGMSKDWRTILHFAAAGLAIVALAVAYFAADPTGGNFMTDWLGVALMFLCPGSLLFATAVDFENLTNSGAALLFVFVVVTNCLIYGAIGAVYVWLRRKRHKALTSSTN
jgi:hypothetical protein